MFSTLLQAKASKENQNKHQHHPPNKRNVPKSKPTNSPSTSTTPFSYYPKPFLSSEYFCLKYIFGEISSKLLILKFKKTVRL